MLNIRHGQMHKGWTVNRRILIFCLPLIALFLAFYVLPLFMTAYYSTVKSAFDHTFVGLQNYIKVFGNRYFRMAVQNTCLFALCAVPLGWLLAFILALCMDHLPKWIGLFAGMLIVPMLLPVSALLPVWEMLFPSAEQAFFSVLTLFLWKYTGFAALLLLSGIRTVPRSCLEAARLDGANGMQVICRMVLPIMRDQAFFVLMLVLVYSFRVFKECYLLYGSYPPDHMYLMQHYINNHFYKLNYQNMTVAAMCMLLIIALLAVWWIRSEKRREGATA